MSTVTEPLLVVILLLNFFLLGTSRLRSAINGSAAQGAILGFLAFLEHGGADWRGLLVAAVVVGLKGILIPVMLGRAMREAAIRREMEPVIHFLPTMLLGAAGTAGSLVLTHNLPLLPEHEGSLVVPAALATVLTGFLLLTTRRKAITQVVGYLVLENGIFMMGLALLKTTPLLVEAGVLLDLVVGIFVMGIIIHHISREFSSLDTTRLTALKE